VTIAIGVEWLGIFRMQKAELDLRLDNWGRWKRNYLCGVGFKSETIESKIMSGEVFGTGCHGGKQGGGGASFREDEEAEKIDLIVRRLRDKGNADEMSVLTMCYVLQWSSRRISGELFCGRGQVTTLLNRAKTLVEGAL